MKRVRYLDLLNIVACLCVIAIHCNKSFDNYSASGSWIFSAILNALYYPCNGIFVMITGATLLDYRDKYDTKQFAVKRIKRVVIPLVIWSLFAIVVRVMTGDLIISGRILQKTKQIINLLLNNGCIYGGVYWFFYMILMIYLMIPVISLIDKAKRKRAFEYIIVLLFITYGLANIFSNHLGISWNEYFRFPIGGPFGIYVFLGYYLSHYDMSKNIKRIIGVLGIIAFCFISIGTILCSLKMGSLYYGFLGWYNWPAMLLCTSVFTFMKSLSNHIDDKILCLFENMSQCSMGIYLIHMYLVTWIPILFNIDTNSIVWKLIAPISIYVICYTVVAMVRKTRVSKILFP